MSKLKKTILSNEIAFNAHYAYLGLGEASKIDIKNPLLDRQDWEIDRPDLHLISLMRNPEYFSFTCKHLLSINLLPMQAATLEELWNRPFPMLIASRGFSKSFSLAIYCILKMLFIPNCKVVICGAAFRQSKIIFEYMETIWRNSPILRDIAGNSNDQGPKRDTDRCTFKLCGSTAIAIPIGDGQKIRGLRASVIIVDEFGSVNPEIYETVISGFAAVSSRPADNVRNIAKRKYLEEQNVQDKEEMQAFNGKFENQAILSGTADYAYSHFGKYWKRYTEIIRSKGNREKLVEIVGEEDADKFNWTDYAVIRIPYELIPEGFMDARQVSRARATIENSTYLMEYGACFPDDSNGFFKRSLIDSCVTSSSKAVKTPGGHEVWFDAYTSGHKDGTYVMGVDPASEKDNFALVILQVCPDHNRVVYTWTTNRKNFDRRKNAGLSKVHDFYGFCVRKIRDLMQVFNIQLIGIDSQGGGVAIEEGLHDPDKMYEGESLIWPTIHEDKEKPTDDQSGLHILEIINFASADWTTRANHGLKKDMEDKALLFPEINSVTLALALEHDVTNEDSNIYDSLEDCMLEIEELKRELATIIHMVTDGGRERWDTPETKSATGKKARLRKDRYSALVIANTIARNVKRALPQNTKAMSIIGGFAHDIAANKNIKSSNGNVPDWYKGVQKCDFRAV